MCTVKNFNDLNRFLNELHSFDVSQNPFLSYSFLSVYLKYYPKGDFRFYYIYENDELIGIVPFECTFQSKLLKIEKLRFIGYRHFNYEQYICKDEDMKKIHNSLMDYLNSLSYSIVLNIYDINTYSPLFPVLVESSCRKKILNLYACPFLKFIPEFDVFFKAAYSSSKKRAELRKFQKKLCELGDFRIINVENEESYNKNIQYINQIFKVHSERFSNVYATSFFGSEKMRPYYSELIKSLMYGERGHISLLVLDDVVIAFIFCLTNGKVLIDWIPAFDPAFSKYSLGLVQYKMLFEIICNEGKYELFDYSKGSSVYKRKWAKEETSNYQFIILPLKSNIAATLIYFFDCFKFKFKVFLRNYGVLSLVKRILGRIRKASKSEVQNYYIVRGDEAEVGINYSSFSYKDIREFPVECRERILDALYQGDKVLSIVKGENRVLVTISGKE